MGTTLELYGGIDLHGNNVYVTLMDPFRKMVAERRISNDLQAITDWLKPYRERIKRLAVESTYNWYWIVDGLKAVGYDIRLANPVKMQENIGLKEANDKTDARFLARQLVNGTLPEGYVYPKETRGVRDMMRYRQSMVQDRTSVVLNQTGLIARHTGVQMSIATLKGCSVEDVLAGMPDALAMAQANARRIDFLNAEITAIEKRILAELPDKDIYALLMTVPGIGPVIARLILLETGPISRFKEAGNYASYARAVRSIHTSNNKKKGNGNSKCGNKYLGWAFVEAATFAARHSPEINAWFQRKEARSGKRVIAIKALANKLAKVCFFIMRDKAAFDVKRLVG